MNRIQNNVPKKFKLKIFLFAVSLSKYQTREIYNYNQR